jgi:phosphomannomutase
MAGAFKAYDIRGVYPTELNEALAESIGRAFVIVTNSEEVAVGRDCRLSSPALADALMKGIMAQGAHVIDLGECSTPAIYLAARRHDAIMVTASHNPAAYNGFKLCKAGGLPIAAGSGLEELEALARRGIFPPARQGTLRPAGIIRDYAALVKAQLRLRRPLKAVVDCSHGMSSLTLPPALEGSGCEVTWLCRGLDGRFPTHEPDPLKPANTSHLQDAVLSQGADIGIAFDGDADRVFFIDDKGRRVESDQAMVLFARHFLAQEPGAKLLYAVNCSRVFREEVERLGGIALPTRIGHAPAKYAMRREGAIFGGELSGHYYHRDFNWCDSGELSAALMLSILSAHIEPLSSMVEPLRRYAKSPEINFRVGSSNDAMAAVEQAHPGGRTHRIDGLTVEFDDWWLNLRPSHTEPYLRLNLEAANQQELERRVADVSAIIQRFAP